MSPLIGLLLPSLYRRFAVKEGLQDVKERLYPVTVAHVLYTVMVFLVSGLLTEYLCGFYSVGSTLDLAPSLLPVSINRGSVDRCHKSRKM